MSISPSNYLKAQPWDNKISINTDKPLAFTFFSLKQLLKRAIKLFHPSSAFILLQSQNYQRSSSPGKRWGLSCDVFQNRKINCWCLRKLFFLWFREVRVSLLKVWSCPTQHNYWNCFLNPYWTVKWKTLWVDKTIKGNFSLISNLQEGSMFKLRFPWLQPLWCGKFPDGNREPAG